MRKPLLILHTAAVSDFHIVDSEAVPPMRSMAVWIIFPKFPPMITFVTFACDRGGELGVDAWLMAGKSKETESVKLPVCMAVLICTLSDPNTPADVLHQTVSSERHLVLSHAVPLLRCATVCVAPRYPRFFIVIATA